MKGRIVEYKTFDKISRVALEFLKRRVGLENIDAVGYGRGSYAKSPLIIKTRDGKTYKLNTKSFSILRNGKWVILKRNWADDILRDV